MALKFGKDANGSEILEMGFDQKDPRQGVNRIVMMEWEKPYMEALVEVLRITPEDEVLEIGFGLGYSATAIQRYKPKRHVIIECDPAVLAKARTWASERPNVDIVEGYWQKELPRLTGLFDAVFFDDFPLPIRDDGGDDKDALKKMQDAEARIITATGSRWHCFLDLAVIYHMRQGARATGYLSEDLEMGRPGCTYTRSTFSVNVPSNCTYALPGKQTYYLPLLRVKDGCPVLNKSRDLNAADEEAFEGNKKQSKRRKRMLEHVLDDIRRRERNEDA